MVSILFILLTTVVIHLQQHAARALYLPAEEPDVYRNVSQLITSKGFPLEEYEVQTSDGYILSVQRIPYGKKNQNTPSKKVLYLQHGILGATSDFLLNFETSSLGFVLANAGYDVWLGNSRGNKYSRKHVKYTTKDKEFWQFSYDEMALYDLPATIDFVLNATKQKQLYYVGHSQGTTILFAMLSSLPDYNSKIKVGLALAPVAFEKHMKGLLQLIAPFEGLTDIALNMFGQYEYLPSEGFIKDATKAICETPTKLLCKNTMFLIGGPDPQQLNDTRLPVYGAHFPSGTSTRNVFHHSQGVVSGKFQKFDYGLITNLVKYHQLTPPQYPLEKVTAPIGLLWGQNDWLGDPTDVAELKKHLKNIIADFRVPFTPWSHIDFVLAKDADKYLYPKVLSLLSSY